MFQEKKKRMGIYFSPASFSPIEQVNSHINYVWVKKLEDTLKDIIKAQRINALDFPWHLIYCQREVSLQLLVGFILTGLLCELEI